MILFLSLFYYEGIHNCDADEDCPDYLCYYPYNGKFDNVGLSFVYDDLHAAFTLNDKANVLNASYYHSVYP
ncbi:Voltage-dependent anion-selective channel protein 1 [Trifolium repens]|nr:Voltage-dependent anion-selective channel protein 1 [Trifolium repens]